MYFYPVSSLCISLHPFGTSGSESFPGSLRLNWVSCHQCPRGYINSFFHPNKSNPIPPFVLCFSKMYWNILSTVAFCCFFPCGFKSFNLLCYHFIRRRDKCIYLICHFLTRLHEINVILKKFYNCFCYTVSLYYGLAISDTSGKKRPDSFYWCRGWLPWPHPSPSKKQVVVN